MDARVATTADLVSIWSDGEGYDLRHQMPQTLVQALDDHGYHVLMMETWGGKGIQHVTQPLHHTLSGILKLAHDPRPYCVRIDVTDKRWVNLEPWETWHKRMQAEQDERERMAVTVVSPEVFDEIEANLAEPAGPSPALREAAKRAVAVIERKNDDGEDE